MSSNNMYLHDCVNENAFYEIQELDEKNIVSFFEDRGEKDKIEKLKSLKITNKKLFDEIKDILSQKTDNEIWIDNKAERCEKIKEISSGGDCMKLVELIRRMHFHSNLQLKKGRRLHITDERFLKEAEKMVCDEVSVVLHIDRNDVLPLVLAG